MKFFYTFLLSVFFATTNAQQNNTYLTDLTALRNILEKTPSYRDQIKGETLVAYDSLFNRLKVDSNYSISDYKYFYNMAQLFFPIQDNHLGFYQINKFPKESEYPTFKGSLDSLKSALTKKALDSVEGIYHYGDIYDIGLFKRGPNEYIGVVLNSKANSWKNGQIAVHLYETKPGYFKAIYAHPKFKNLNLYQIEKYSHHSLVNSHFYSSFSDDIYTKVKHKTDFINLPGGTSDFTFKDLSKDIQYLQIKHFNADKVAMEKSQTFYDSIKNLLKPGSLILDLRNNDGGAEKVSRKYYKLLEEYSKTEHVYILVNNGTMSQGEIFTLQLKHFPNVKVLGQTTRGTLTYGSNYGKREKLPSQSFEVYITDMGGDKRLIPYENYGVNPDIVLTGDKDWIQQTIEIIRKK